MDPFSPSDPPLCQGFPLCLVPGQRFLVSLFSSPPMCLLAVLDSQRGPVVPRVPQPGTRLMLGRGVQGHCSGACEHRAPVLVVGAHSWVPAVGGVGVILQSPAGSGARPWHRAWSRAGSFWLPGSTRWTQHPQDVVPGPPALFLTGLTRAAGSHGDVPAAPRAPDDCDAPGSASEPVAGEALAAAENGAASSTEKVENGIFGRQDYRSRHAALCSRQGCRRHGMLGAVVPAGAGILNLLIQTPFGQSHSEPVVIQGHPLSVALMWRTQQDGSPSPV